MKSDPGAFARGHSWFRTAGLWCLFTSCFLSVARAQYVIESWTTDSGLPQNSVLSIQQTPDGYLWFTTFDGLVRFDGVRFTVYNKSNSPGLTSNRIIKLLAEQDGTLWACTEGGGFVKYRNGRFQAFTMADGLASNSPDRVQRDIDGSLLIEMRTGVAHLREGHITSDAPQHYRERNAYVSPRGVRWNLSVTGLWATMNGREIRHPLPFPISVERDYDLSGAQMVETPDGALWLAFTGSLYRLAGGMFTAHGGRCGMPLSRIRAIAHDREGHVWLGTERDGACRYANGRFTCYKSTDGLSSDDARSIFQDREGNIWVGTNERGLNRLSRRVVFSVSTASGLPERNIYPILADSRGDIWAGAEHGLTRIRAGSVIRSFGRSDGLLHEDVQSLSEDRAGRLWIGSDGGVAYYANGRFTDMTASLDFDPGRGCFFIHEDAVGTFWFGTDAGLLRRQHGKLRRYTVADGLPSDEIKVVLEARNGALWFGTYGGLARLDGERFIAYTELNGLASNHVRALHEDGQGTLWIGTYDGGLSRLRNGVFTNYTIARGLFSNGVFKILEDARGNFWMSSNQGIYRVSWQQLEDVASGRTSAVVSTPFGKSDGMLNSECNGGRQAAGAKTRDGKLWFPTQDGIAVIDPEGVPRNPLPPPVVIESGELQGLPVQLAGGLRLKPGDMNLEIRYTGLSFIKPEQVRFRYRLEGLDDNWVEAGTRRAAFYPYLPPGRYVFRVTAANSDLIWNEEGAALPIIVLPPFYRTWWFLTLVCLSALGTASLVWKRHVWQLKRAHAVQQAFSRQLIESQEGERKRIAAELHDSLGQHLLIIRNRAVLGLRVGNDPRHTKEQLDEINASASSAIDEVRHIAYNLRPLNLDRLGLTAVIEEMIEKVSSASGIEFSGDITPLDGSLTPDDAINLYRIIQESINNVVRHAHATRASVEIWHEDRDLLVTVADDGRGFSPESPARSGLGLTSIAERVRMLGGTHTIASTPGRGTTLTIRLPGAAKKNSNGA